MRESERKRLVGLIKSIPHGINTFGDVTESLYIENVMTKHLLENKVKVLHCEAGDTLWYLDYGLPKCFICPEKIVVQDIVLLKNTMLIRCSGGITLRTEYFGKTVFTSREEAEAKLKGGESDE